MHMTGRELHNGLAPVISAPSLPHLWTGSQAGAGRPLLLTTTFIFAPSLCVPCPGTDTMVILTSLGQPGLWPRGQVWEVSMGQLLSPICPHTRPNPLLTAPAGPCCLAFSLLPARGCGWLCLPLCGPFCLPCRSPS